MPKIIKGYCDVCGCPLRDIRGYTMCGKCHIEAELLHDIKLSPEYLKAKRKIDEIRDRQLARRKKQLLTGV